MVAIGAGSKVRINYDAVRGSVWKITQRWYGDDVFIVAYVRSRLNGDIAQIIVPDGETFYTDNVPVAILSEVTE